ncbi:UDP-N-acetylmuramoyl-L-alanyl-D-glutamate--2,6-diaminopimelate ligase [Alkalimonas sp. MEB108]|uniref:UDP-N-acetylmuramoyl-L-alanyl-D-glutamate--2,6-diaminopimelate ligase n=1 Tax=Alkalimonas cellulosilytica TaxID=3058395 RepID=A0ABU7J2Y3_9GAMM|nr:UDP-N-acetylmuramoyl-L-alanyl-D-glutamate--2,6-diaminopimelate ligase [Alkalimonas sp. MEB108]MEE2000854.1 UDP-N-acetylmuramoyl-L-alanyl-D-glutamate--2,6-diaminopimelate ligase [Alkalimonas sp. MEB108]
MPVNTALSWLGAMAAHLPQQPLQQLQIDSRAVREGDVFLALPGHQQHGKAFIGQALQQGAALVLSDEIPAEYAEHSRVLLLPDLLIQLQALARRFYQDPAAGLQLIAVTGTNGKSSTACFVQQLAQQLLQRSAVIGTLGYGRPDKLTALPNTTPHQVELQKILAELKQDNCALVAMEVSSHAMVQGRVEGLQFDVAIFTNLSRDHLDYHGTMEAYGAAKARLLTPAYCRQAVVNVSDAYGAGLARQLEVPYCAVGKLDDCQQHSRYLGYSQVEAVPGGFRCKLQSDSQQFTLQLPLMGDFNIDNAVAAIAALWLQGSDLAELCQAASLLGAIPGRMEQFDFPHPLTLVVDFAHTPDALQLALQALRPHCQGHLWCVFGCGGDRDQGKRPLMGRVAQQYADRVVITSDNPRHEPMEQICQQIAAGMSAEACYQIEPDRELAIKLALSEAQAGDMILLAGKGHERYQQVGDNYRDYDERAFIAQLQREMSL